MGLWYTDVVWEDAFTFEMMCGEQVKKGDAIFPRLDIEKELAELEAMNKPAEGAEGNQADSGETAQAAEEESIPLELKPLIVYDDFDKIDIRGGRVLSAEKHPKADKLLVFKIKLGTEIRQIISGVAEYFKPEEMVGKKVIVVANLKPRKLRGLESNGMLLFAENGERLEMVTTIAEDGNVVN